MSQEHDEDENVPHEPVIKDFRQDVLKDYETNLPLFFDPDTEAVREPKRDDDSPGFLYTEVTGYSIQDSLLLYEITKDESYREKAKRSAKWIVGQAMDECGGVKTRYYFEKDTDPRLEDKSFSGRRIYAFDTGVCLRGLTTLYNATNDSSLIDPARKMGDFLVDVMIDSGRVSPIYNASEDEIVPEASEVWSKRSGAFLAKIGEGLIDLYEITKDEKYKEAAVKICQTALKSQLVDGNFETSPTRTELHPHFYAAEGLLYVGIKTSTQEFIDAAKKATEWALSKCNNGEIGQRFDTMTGNPLSKPRTDALAQALAIACKLREINQLNPKYFVKMDDIAQKILNMKSNNGYYNYGYYENDEESTTMSYWTQMFAFNALYSYTRVSQTKVE